MAVWIRVTGAQLEYFDPWAMKKVGNMLGKVLKIYILTNARARGKFARICVELDLTGGFCST